MITQMDIACVTNDGKGASFFSRRVYSLSGESQRMLSAQIPAVNFRLRTSDTSYSSDWHVAGDPTLLIVLCGTLRIHLRNDETRDFNVGEMFIAEDFLEQTTTFDDKVHGHRASVVGNQPINVLHLKLEKR